MVHRDSHPGNGEQVSTAGEEKSAIHSNVIGHDDHSTMMVRRRRRQDESDAIEEDRDGLIKLSITECSTLSGDDREGPPSPSDTFIEQQKTTKENQAVKKRSILWTLARILLLDTPLLLILCAFMCLSWLHYVHDNYLLKQLEAATWTHERDTTDATYYYRYCDERDLSTTNPLDLYLPDNATPDDAYQHQLKHGFTVFPGVLSEETSTKLRNYIVDKNRKLSEEESIWLIEWSNRWSFGLGIEEPSVSAAVMELTSNQRLKQSMEKILGRNPALIELTSITSAYGAKGQEFHHDGRTNLAQYGRGVAHSYSIFIMLQNTTREMGATGACPGTHYCAEADDLCETHGLQPANEDGHWATGDALVMNMDGWHRGSAHTDPNGADRVMVCMTFTSRPRERAESRFLPQGISYSLRWDLWGHTWNDLATADTTMRQPWTTLRALGLYKKPSAEYGIDYVSSATQRIANEWFGFMDEDLEAFVRFGGFKFLPLWLQGELNDKLSWQAFLLDTLLLCEEFMKSVSKYSAGLYVLLCSAAGLVVSGGIRGSARRFASAMFRLAVMLGAVFAVYKAAIKHVDDSPWASDLRQGLRYTSPFGSDVSEYEGPLTTPHRNDVLIETRYKSDYLVMANDFIGGFPGNRVWNELVDDKASLYASYSGLPPAFSDAVPEYIVSAVEENSGRLLYQTWQSHWTVMSRDDSVKYTKLELHVKSNSILRNIMKELEFLISEAKYGYLRKTVMMEKDIFPYLLQLKDVLVGVSKDETKTAVATVRPGDVSMLRSHHFVPSRSLSMPQTTDKLLPRPVNLHVGQVPGEPEPDAWLRGGDLITVKHREQGRWGLYKATLTYVLSSGICFVRFHVDDKFGQVECKSEMTSYSPPHVDDSVDVKIEDQYHSATIIKDKGDGLYDIKVSGRLFENVSDDIFRRPLYARRG